MPLEVLIVGSLLLGLALGSFANVVIARVPQQQSVVRPPSACPRCGAAIRRRDNVPLVSWVLLRARCRNCHEPISGRYPLVELGCGLLCAAIAWRIGWDWALPAYLLFGWLLLVVAVIDLQTFRIPNRLTYPLTPTLLVLLVVAALAEGVPAAAVRAVLGGVLAFAILLLMALINPRGMGMGDVKLAAFIGLGLGYLGWGHLWLGLFAGFFGGGLIAAVLLASGVRGRKDHIPFGPWLALGAVVTLLIGRPIIDIYLRWSGMT
jgi:leader peptidase (prepilin peptidase) / N-methyltransferase